jgi:hypothetical protein
MVRDWVIAASFLSMIEIMSSYLDNVFALLSFLRAGYSDKKTEIGTEQKFERKSVNDKLSYLRKEFGFDPQHGEVVRTMTNVRNVIVHNAGWVHNKHCNNKDKNQLVLRWKGLKLEKPVEGVLVEVPHEHRGPAAGPGEMIRWEVVIKEKTFKVGQQIEISPYEIGDIGWSVSEVMQDIKTKVHKEAEKAAAMGKKLGKLKLVIDGPADR